MATTYFKLDTLAPEAWTVFVERFDVWSSRWVMEQKAKARVAELDRTIRAAEMAPTEPPIAEAETIAAALLSQIDQAEAAALRGRVRSLAFLREMPESFRMNITSADGVPFRNAFGDFGWLTRNVSGLEVYDVGRKVVRAMLDLTRERIRNGEVADYSLSAKEKTDRIAKATTEREKLRADLADPKFRPGWRNRPGGRDTLAECVTAYIAAQREARFPLEPKHAKRVTEPEGAVRDAAHPDAPAITLRPEWRKAWEELFGYINGLEVRSNG